jgi:hypothetical protein
VQRGPRSRATLSRSLSFQEYTWVILAFLKKNATKPFGVFSPEFAFVALAVYYSARPLSILFCDFFLLTKWRHRLKVSKVPFEE